MKKTSTPVKMARDGALGRVVGGRRKVLRSAEASEMSEDEIRAGAKADPDNLPLTKKDLALMKRAPRIRTLRRALSLTQEQFAARYHIPLGTLRDWEQGRSVPDQPARADLTVIVRDPELVRRTLGPQ